MRNLTVTVFASLDGVMQAPGGPQEDNRGGFVHGGWSVPYADAVFGEAMDECFSKPFALVLGRRTWNIFAAHWPRVPADSEDAGLARAFNDATKYVATHDPASLQSWSNSEALGDDVAGRLRELKATPGPALLTQGSSVLLRQLFATDLVDNLQLLTFPVLLGRGKRWFDDDSLATSFRLERSITTTTGIVISRYRRDGAVRAGAFALS